jgi:hypothetical protein
LLRATAFKEPASYFHRYAALSDEAAEQVAGESWDARSTAQTPREHPADARARPPHPSQGRGSLPRTTCAHCGFVYFDRPPRCCARACASESEPLRRRGPGPLLLPVGTSCEVTPTYGKRWAWPGVPPRGCRDDAVAPRRGASPVQRLAWARGFWSPESSL